MPEKLIRFAVLAAAAFILCLNAASAKDKVVIEYWEKWTGFEGQAMEDVVAAFNASQDRIEVRYSAISQIDLKLMLAIAGKKPPDVAGLWSYNVPVYAENNALRPLDGFAKEFGISEADYIPSIWALCRYRDRLWALPSTPSSLALHWNKKLFREAGLDPERPPKTLAELEEFNAKLTRRAPNGTYLVFGHLPEEPGWWRSMWGFWFGAELWDGRSQLTATDSGNRAALEWIESYPKRFGREQTSAFLEGFGNFASPLNPFIQGKIGMELQGPWMWNFIRQYGTGQFDLGVAAFPSEKEGEAPVTIVESDILIIPAGARHPREAFEFIRFVNQQKNIEPLCAKQCKFTPLVKVSENFWKTHPHPFIHVFYDLAKSPNAKMAPQLTIWAEYRAELDQAIREVWALRETPEAALQRVQSRMQPKFETRTQRWKRIGPALEKTWAQEGQP